MKVGKLDTKHKWKPPVEATLDAANLKAVVAGVTADCNAARNIRRGSPPGKLAPTFRNTRSIHVFAHVAAVLFHYKKGTLC